MKRFTTKVTHATRKLVASFVKIATICFAANADQHGQHAPHEDHSSQERQVRDEAYELSRRSQQHNGSACNQGLRYGVSNDSVPSSQQLYSTPLRSIDEMKLLPSQQTRRALLSFITLHDVDNRSTCSESLSCKRETVKREGNTCFNNDTNKEFLQLIPISFGMATQQRDTDYTSTDGNNWDTRSADEEIDISGTTPPLQPPRTFEIKNLRFFREKRERPAGKRKRFFRRMRTKCSEFGRKTN